MQKKAFTLTELMIATGIFLVLSAIVFGVLAASRTSWNVSSTKVELQQQLRAAMTRIITEINQTAPAVTDRFTCNANCNGEYIQFQLPVATTSPIAGSVFQDDGFAKWGAGGIQGNTIRYAAVTAQFSPTHAGRLVRIAGPPDPRCGDGYCSSGELCGPPPDGCETDCGECPEGEPGGGSEGEGGDPEGEGGDPEGEAKLPQKTSVLLASCTDKTPQHLSWQNIIFDFFNTIDVLGINIAHAQNEDITGSLLSQAELEAEQTGDPEDPEDPGDPSRIYTITVLAPHVNRLEVTRSTLNAPPDKPQILDLTIHGEKSLIGGATMKVELKSAVALKNRT